MLEKIVKGLPMADLARRFARFLVVCALMGCGPRHPLAREAKADCRRFSSVAPLHAEALQATVGKIAGSVVDARSGEELGGAEVQLRLSTGARDSVFSMDGRFEFAPLVAGRYEMRTMRIGYHPRLDTLNLNPAEELRVTLPMDQPPSDECHGLNLVTHKS